MAHREGVSIEVHVLTAEMENVGQRELLNGGRRSVIFAQKTRYSVVHSWLMYSLHGRGVGNRRGLRAKKLSWARKGEREEDGRVRPMDRK